MTHALTVCIKFFVSLPRKVRFGVWIDILAKRKFVILAKILFSYFHLYLVYLFFFLFFVFLF